MTNAITIRNSLIIFSLSFISISIIAFSPMIGLGFCIFLLVCIISIINKEKVFFAFIFLYPMLPRYCAIDLGASLPLLTASRVLIIYVITFDLIFNRNLFINVEHKFSKCKFNKVIAFYFIVYLINFFAYNYGESFKNLISIGLEYIFIFFYIYLRIENDDDVNKVFNCILYSAFVIGVFGLIEFFMQINMFGKLDIVVTQRTLASSLGQARLDAVRVEGPFGHPLAYCNYLLMIIPISVYMIFNSNSKKSKAKYFFIFGILITNLVLSLSRGPMLAFFTGCIVFFLSAEKENKKLILKFVILFGAIIVVGTVAGVVPGVIKNFFISVADTVLMRNSVSNFGDNANAFSYRMYFFDLTRRLVFENGLKSIIIGRGVSFIFVNQIYDFMPMFNKVRLVNTIDNHYLAKLIDVGVLGLFAELLVLAKVLYISISNIVKSISHSFYSCILFSTVTYYACLLTVADLATMRFYWVIMGVVMSKDFIDNRESLLNTYS